MNISRTCKAAGVDEEVAAANAGASTESGGGSVGKVEVARERQEKNSELLGRN